MFDGTARRLRRLSALVLTATLVACTSTESTGLRAEPSYSRSTFPTEQPPARQTTPGRDASPAPAQQSATGTKDRDPLEPAPSAGAGRVQDVTAAILPLGSVPYDGFSLPLLSADGTRVASQTGVAPDWEAAMAELDSDLPFATTVELFSIDIEHRRIDRIVVMEGPMLLGRGGDDEGFLVEWPREDGSRWIGKVSWQTGDVDWIISGDDVNAFATIGPEGQLAWSRRTIDGELFELVVRKPNGHEWSLAEDEIQYLYPTWSGHGDGLFLAMLEDGRLDLAHMVAGDARAARQSTRRKTVATAGSKFLAYQMMIGQPADLAASPSSFEQLAFFHPARHRAAIWRPHVRDGMVQLQRGSITATLTERGYALVPTDEELLLQSVDDLREWKSLLKGVLVPRPTPGLPYPYVLLSPSSHKVGLTAMQLLE
jgi:hypothetical protein